MNNTLNQKWKLYTHPLFDAELSSLIDAVEKAKTLHPETYQSRKETRLLSAVLRVVDDIRADPTQAKFRQGDTLGKDNKHWFRAKFCGQYRLFFRFDVKTKLIILAWLNDESAKRAYGSKQDAYTVFGKMLGAGHPPDNWDALLSHCKSTD